MNRKAIVSFVFVLFLVSVTPAPSELSSTHYSPSTSYEPPGTQWNMTYGGGGIDGAVSVQQTTDGGYVIAGYTNSYGAGGYDFYLVKTDVSGNKIWNRTYGGGSNDLANYVQQTTDGGYVMAGVTNSFGAGSDFWLVKTDVNGNMVWNRTFGGPGNDVGEFVQQTTDGGYIIAGFTRSFGAGRYDFWLVKTDAGGNMVWNQTYGGADNDYAFSAQQTTDGGYIMAGGTNSFGNDNGTADFWLVKTDASGNKIWNRTYGGGANDLAYCVQQTTDSGYIMAGGTNSFGAGGDDFWLVKTDASGNMVWNQTYGGANDSTPCFVQQTTDGGYVTTGNTFTYGNDNGTADFWLVKTDASGNMVWNRTYGGALDDQAACVRQTTDGGYIVAGYTESFGAGLADFWLVKVAPESQLVRYDVTITAHCITDGKDVSVAITEDGAPTDSNTPDTFTGLTGTHTFTVPDADASGHPFKQWSTGETSTTITVSSGDTYTAYYRTPPVHAVAVDNIRPSKTVVGQSYSQNITGTVLDRGDYPETCNVTAYYGNGTFTPEQWNSFWSMGDCNRDGYINEVDKEILENNFGWSGPPGNNPADLNSDGTVDMLDAIRLASGLGKQIWKVFLPVIDTETVVDLTVGNSAVLLFAWNTTGVAYGNYTISACAWPAPGETDTSDNNYTCNVAVHVGVPGDISGPTLGVYDGKCDLRDVSYLIIRFNSRPNSANWNANADINNDGTVNMRDVQIPVLNFNKHE